MVFVPPSNVEQRTPVVRVKSENGEDYYVDARDSIMPRTKYQSNLLVATGNITKYYAQNYVAPMSRYITDSELWNNQIEQIYIRPDKGVELIPRVGDHIVNIGRPPESNDRSTREKDIEEFTRRNRTSPKSRQSKRIKPTKTIKKTITTERQSLIRRRQKKNHPTKRRQKNHQRRKNNNEKYKTK